MKTKFYCVICVLSLFTPICLRAQDTIKPLEFSAIISAEGKSQSQLFTLAKIWFSETFQAGTAEPYKVEEPELGILIYNVSQAYMFHKQRNAYTMTMRCKGRIYYSLKLEAKDNRLKLSATSFTHEGQIYIDFNGEVRFSLGRLTTSDYGDPDGPK